MLDVIIEIVPDDVMTLKGRKLQDFLESKYGSRYHDLGIRYTKEEGTHIYSPSLKKRVKYAIESKPDLIFDF